LTRFAGLWMGSSEAASALKMKRRSRGSISLGSATNTERPRGPGRQRPKVEEEAGKYTDRLPKTTLERSDCPPAVVDPNDLEDPVHVMRAAQP
jgi:hypothetical protein